MTCRICNSKTDVVYIIKREEVPVCRGCSSEIFIQQARRYAANGSIFNKPKIITKPKEYDKEKIITVLEYVDKLRKVKRDYSKNLPKAYLELVGKRLEDGYTVEQLLAVAHFKYKEWGQDPKMKIHFKVDTLYRPMNFERYLAEVPEEGNPQNTKEQRDILKKLNYYIVTGERNEETNRLVEQLKATGYDKQNILKQFE